MKNQTVRIIVRRDSTRGYFESGKLFLIFPDEMQNDGLVAYCAPTGHGRGDYLYLMKKSKPVTDSEALEAVKAFGYNDIDFKIVKKR